MRSNTFTPGRCRHHPDRDGVGICVKCGTVICTECSTRIDGINYCTHCLTQLQPEDKSRAGKNIPGFNHGSIPWMAILLSVATISIYLLFQFHFGR